MKNHSYVSNGKNVQTDLNVDIEMVFAPKKNICVEVFEEGALILHIGKRELTELDTNEHWTWNQIDGKKTIEQIAISYSKKFIISKKKALLNVWSLYQKLWQDRSIIELIKNKRGDVMSQTKYIQNPDVNLREEDEDGALLFNPDTDQVKLLNQTGHYIWKRCQKEVTIDQIIEAFKKDFDDVPENQIKSDIEEFVKQMVDTGFIGILEENK